jgi:hypothetical protein
MNLALFAAAFVMSVSAFAFVATPLVRSQRQQSNGSINMPLLGAIAVFGLGIVLYGVVGSPDVKSHDPASNMTAASNATGTAGRDKVGSVASLLSGLETRLEENPEDGKGWLLLAQSYELLDRIEEARVAYEKATTLGQSNDDLAARLAHMSDESADGVKIRGHVAVDPVVQDRIDSDAAVYVIAKSVNNPMPLAVLRRPATELPFDFILSDADLMVRGANLATAGSLTILVKISASGDALARDAGLEATREGVEPLSGELLSFVIGSPDTI